METPEKPVPTAAVQRTVGPSAGQFVLMAYLAPYFKQKMNVTPTELSLYFMWFGAFGFIGNFLMSRNMDRIGPARTVMAGTCSMALTLVLWPLGTTLVLASLVAVPWALGCFSANSAQQARLVGIAPTLAAGSIALNSSAMYAGQAIGAAGGGWLIVNSGGMDPLHWAGLASMFAAMGVSALATRQRRA